MLVNLSPNPKARVKAEKNCKRMIREYSGARSESAKYTRKILRLLRRRVYCFKGFFKPYTPAVWEYTKNEPDEDFTGIYIIPDHNSIGTMINFCTRQHAPDHYARENYDSGDIWYSYGLCDNASQVIQYYKKMKAEGRFHGNHIITLVVMGKGTGWRWHKWGAYIGNFDPSYEYFDDEEGIEAVYAFQIHRVK